MTDREQSLVKINSELIEENRRLRRELARYSMAQFVFLCIVVFGVIAWMTLRLLGFGAA